MYCFSDKKIMDIEFAFVYKNTLQVNFIKY